MTAVQPPAKSVEYPHHDPVKMLTVGYVLALLIIGLMSITIHMIIDQIVAEQDSVAVVVSKSANQSMLAQKIALLSTQYVSKPAAETRDHLKTALSKMTSIHATLVNAENQNKSKNNPLPAAVREIYFEHPYDLNKRMDDFSGRVEALINKPVKAVNARDENYQFIINQADGTLASALEAAVSAYESAIVGKINRLQWFQRVAVVVILATLLAEAFFIFMPLVSRVREYAGELKRIAMTDLLTAVGNRRFLSIRGEQEIRRCRRLEKKLCLALLDIDFFKKINDNYGHQAGDYILQEFVHLTQKGLRVEDVLSRVGGEEFAVLLPHTDMDGALKVTERIRRNVEQANLKTEKGQSIKITVSIGLAEVDLRQDDLEKAMVQADMALYEAKRKGRNRIIYNNDGQLSENPFSAQAAPVLTVISS